MKRRRLLLCLGLLMGCCAVHAEQLVVARSVASPSYLQQRYTNGIRQPQSYVFMPGRYFAGTTHDRTLDRTTFRTIAERLAIDLRKQDFFPASALAKADLLLIVHWGVTTGNFRDTVSIAASMESFANIGREVEVVQKQYDDAVTMGDFEGATRARDQLISLERETKEEVRSIRASQYAGDENSATLLGLNAELQKADPNPFGDSRRQALLEMTKEERYFVVVMAYDARELVSTKQLRKVWTLRASISSAGVNFHQALDRMGQIASRYFGTQQDGVTFDHASDRKRTEVFNYGELKVLGIVER